jgi:Winged helix-turn helix
MYQRRTLTLADEERVALLYHRDHDPKPYVRERCAALLKIADGHSLYAVAHAGLLRNRDPDTVYTWLDHYQDEGLPGLFAHRHGGNRRGCL